MIFLSLWEIKLHNNYFELANNIEYIGCTEQAYFPFDLFFCEGGKQESIMRIYIHIHTHNTNLTFPFFFLICVLDTIC